MAVRACPCTFRANIRRSVHSPCKFWDVRARPCMSVHIRARPCTSVRDPCSFLDVRADFEKSVHVRACPCIWMLASVHVLDSIYAFNVNCALIHRLNTNICDRLLTWMSYWPVHPAGHIMRDSAWDIFNRFTTNYNWSLTSAVKMFVFIWKSKTVSTVNQPWESC